MNTHEELNAAVNLLSQCAKKLPEGYLLHLQCSRHTHMIMLTYHTDGDYIGESVPLKDTSWGTAVEVAISRSID